MTRVQRAAQIFGWVFIVVGALGFFASGGSMEANPAEAPRLLGLFPVNLLHNLVHLGSGVWGVLAAGSFGAAVLYCRILGVVYLALVPLGAIAPALFGVMPIGSHDLWLHAILGLGLVYFGFAAREPARRRTSEGAGVA